MKTLHDFKHNFQIQVIIYQVLSNNQKKKKLTEKL